MNATAIGIRAVMKDSRSLNHLFMTMNKYHPCNINVREVDVMHVLFFFCFLF